MARRPRLEPRETRTEATQAWLGRAADLALEFARSAPPRRIRTFSEAAPDDLRTALAILSEIPDLGLVVHGPRGCGARAPGAAPLAVTDLDERDTVLGSGEVLAETIRALDAAHPLAGVAVLGSPVVAINSDDIRATVAELGTALDKPVVWVRTEGFRSAVTATGGDAAADALLQLVDAEESEREVGLLNLLTSTRGPELQAFARQIEGLGWRVNILPAGASVADIARAGRAEASLVLAPDLLDLFAEGLETRFGVVRLDVALPLGAQATTAVLRRVAALGGMAPPLAPPRNPSQPLAGRRIALALPTAWGLATADLIGDLGGAVVALSVPHVERSHAAALGGLAERWPDLQIHVGEGQGFERAGLFRRTSPDLLLGESDAVAGALRQGLPAAVLDPARLIGAGAAETLTAAVETALARVALARSAAQHARPGYTPGWLKRSPDWHIKQEVR
ncbi:nitrogenase molybdenum-iron protein alpha/beta subunit [Rhodobacter viridis]|uniref:Nitrogenase molybdenum-iron protein alpha/beta subunit n=1 Tax=Rhodobacter viridis TaxID=1054202 RepID=A0A318U2K3_9RHOB|nr:nitrogenase component 1 [Rhodobacter viridis]PYF12690.1 nitrogenase molybdenum-iron protein alpha/beta subunit [Rhodobacter viridis]